jgi:transcriptional regulator with XRE-family HTH domain
MATLLNTDKLASLLKAKRGEKGLRAVAQEIGGISASTLSRIEQGNLPDVDTFIRICKWLELSPQEFTNDENSSYRKASNQEIILSHLRADRTLLPKTIAALSEMINMAYEKH